ncbi:hypothetical protein H7H73_32715 [Mycobacterium rufum]|uniref:Uncharacterized protein n=1 Tax=Mycolicibacterium rufum TaxID=318424 RepID=A0A9X2Y5H4_9MYCO|nr:hypothetical protein [Mycolicibacterium rufum]
MVTAMIAELYTDLAVLPPHYTPQQRAEVITDAADTTATELTTLLDASIHQEADRPPVTEYGSTMHTDDRHHALTAMLATLAANHLTWWLTDRLADFVTSGGNPVDSEGEVIDTSKSESGKPCQS